MEELIYRIDEEKPGKKVKIDVKDRKILSLLANNSRTPLTQIAKKVGLSRDSINYRIKRLQRLNVILKFMPIIDLKKFGYFTYHVFFLLDESDKEKQKELIGSLRKNKYVKDVIEYSDRWDLEIVMVAKSIQKFDEHITEIASQFSDIVLEKSKLALIKGYNSIHLPNKFHIDKEDHVNIEYPNVEEGSMDEKDIKILKGLSEDARKSTYALGRDVGLSSDAVIYRIKNMQKEGIIRKFSILVNLSALSYHLFTFAMQVKMLDQKNDNKFREFTLKHPNIIRAVKTMGGWDLLLYIAAESPKEFHKTVKEIKNVFASIINNYQTWVAYKEHYYDHFPEILHVK